MKTLRQLITSELQATQQAFQLMARHHQQKLNAEEWQLVREQMGKLLFFVAFLFIPFGSLLLPLIFRSSTRPPVNYWAWTRRFTPTRGLR